MVTLGLDISTSCVGYAFTENKKILDMGFIDIKKFTTHREKAFYVLTCINESSYIDKVEKVYVEDNLSGFAGGRTSQQVIVKLAKFNAVLCYVVEDTFDIEVKRVNSLIFLCILSLFWESILLRSLMALFRILIFIFHIFVKGDRVFFSCGF